MSLVYLALAVLCLMSFSGYTIDCPLARRKPMKMPACIFRIAATTCLFALAAAATAAARAEDPAAVFRNPPDAAKPLVYWFWMGRNITAEGITGDLETLKAAGFGGTTMCNLGDICTPWPYEIGHGLNPDMVPYVSESWWKLVRHAAAESRRLGLDFGLHNCPGYESNGGPWITPELSMQEICFTQTTVAGPGKVHRCRAAADRRSPCEHALSVYNADNGRVEKPEIAARKTYYRDIAVLALPAAGIVPKDKVVDLTSRLTEDGTARLGSPGGHVDGLSLRPHDDGHLDPADDLEIDRTGMRQDESRGGRLSHGSRNWRNQDAPGRPDRPRLELLVVRQL